MYKGLWNYLGNLGQWIYVPSVMNELYVIHRKNYQILVLYNLATTNLTFYNLDRNEEEMGNRKMWDI